ncbi:hypothetical protein SEA_BLINN1_84 [Mycobacterium phage Blinn1]|uniref:Uncharacterized protein n=2 Tax=Gladiatorvirus TaxID=2948726 RepID=A0A2U8UQ33_9CAUD|nr:hypothetical protein KIP53_gp025 [Mycobacterium phage Blinn1]YP_010061306.1 hypothetical protein KIP55_gp028 [Mycobacterium phage Priamo]AWN05844.1 hypothetical protein SEA_PRIAMO_82 [Mycobacterium phage Priamo]QGJ94844.1 hypothetical protein SEA_BLINN1_84 [Mycobacterium phage Blinn1]
MTKTKRVPLSPELATNIFKEVWSDGMLLYDIAGKLTCTEFEALADLMLALGFDPETVEAFEEGHADQDECGDMHSTCDHPECKEEV